MVPAWLHWLPIGSLIVAAACALVIAGDLFRHPQHMRIMNVVWPVTALFGSMFAVWAYYRWGRLATHAKARAAMRNDDPPPHKEFTPFPVMVGKGAAHCGSGCTLGDICAEWLAILFPVIATWFGWMRDLGVVKGLVQAVKADTLSLTAWQVGMYGFMAIAHFWLFKHLLGVKLKVPSVEFWFMMQIAMWSGFATSYPVNWWLLKRGIKERM